ncbi:hypothetical protein D9619_013347 [Psilocybe cf. subviscida]|uniref:Uncharacterized protein n=1 Tax=Psilocybe cf. subviscida TaxID=2480587 RepID=A0A8H5BS47_9AGAR|nr:hypothetical protein D9619_013347 [Psilocybe cf. subviscida]
MQSGLLVIKNYQVLTRFQATHGPATSLSLSHDGSYLASGGDNKSVHIWDIEEGKNIAVLSDRLERWGQITCVKWLEGVAQPRGYTLCFGTGRGFILFYEKVKDSDLFRELTCRAVFPFNDPVEAIDHDSHKERLIVSSHAGKIGMYSVGKQGTFLESIWTKKLSDVMNGKGTIPRAVHFVGAGDSVIICGLETGVIFSKASNNGNDSWNQQIKSSMCDSGHLRLSPNGNMVLVDNLVDGFDLYTFPGLEHFEYLEIPRCEAYLHSGTFAEGSNVTACGSDHGQVYLFSTTTGKYIEKLHIGTKTSIIQAVDAFSNDKHHLIAAATNDDIAEIVIWKKLRVKAARSRGSGAGGPVSLKVMIFLNLMILVVALAVFLPFRFRQELPYDKMEILRRKSEDAQASELAKARAAHVIHEARIVSMWRREMARGDDETGRWEDKGADQMNTKQKRAETNRRTDVHGQQKEITRSSKEPERQMDKPRHHDVGEVEVGNSGNIQRRSEEIREDSSSERDREGTIHRRKPEGPRGSKSKNNDSDMLKSDVLKERAGEKVQEDSSTKQQGTDAEFARRGD